MQKKFRCTNKLLCFIITIAILCGVTVYAQPSASSDAAVLLSVDRPSAAVGETITVQVFLQPDSANGISSIDMAIQYNPNEMSYIQDSFADGHLFPYSSNHCANNAVHFSGVVSDTIQTRGILFTFKVKLLQSNSSITLQIKSAALGDFDGTDVTKSVQNNSTKQIDIGCTHAFGAWQTVKTPTCETEGTEKRICTLCKKEETRFMPKAPHQILESAWVTDRVPTADRGGERHAVCSVCGQTVYQSTPKTGQAFTYLKNNAAPNTITITGYFGQESIVYVPKEIDGFTVRSVADNAFAFQDSIEAIVLPEDVQYIGQYAFFGCSALQYLVFANAEIKTSPYTFENMPALKTLYGDAGSTASLTAQNLKKAFRLLGDANGDGRIEDADTELLLQVACGAKALSTADFLAADLNIDQAADAFDAAEAALLK